MKKIILFILYSIFNCNDISANQTCIVLKFDKNIKCESENPKIREKLHCGFGLLYVVTKPDHRNLTIEDLFHTAFNTIEKHKIGISLPEAKFDFALKGDDESKKSIENQNPKTTLNYKDMTFRDIVEKNIYKIELHDSYNNVTITFK